MDEEIDGTLHSLFARINAFPITPIRFEKKKDQEDNNR